MPVREVEEIQADSRYEEEKIPQVEPLSNWKDISKADLSLELEEIKRKYAEDIYVILLGKKLLLKHIR